jgi:hypothetical protein
MLACSKREGQAAEPEGDREQKIGGDRYRLRSRRDDPGFS